MKQPYLRGVLLARTFAYHSVLLYCKAVLTAGTNKPRKVVIFDVLESVYHYNMKEKHQNSTAHIFSCLC